MALKMLLLILFILLLLFYFRKIIALEFYIFFLKIKRKIKELKKRKERVFLIELKKGEDGILEFEIKGKKIKTNLKEGSYGSSFELCDDFYEFFEVKPRIQEFEEDF